MVFWPNLFVVWGHIQLKRNIEKKYGRIVVVTYSHTHARGAECRRHEERGAAGTEGVGVWGGGITSPMGYGSAERDFLEEVFFFCWKRSLFLEEVYFVGGGDVSFWSRVALTGHRMNRQI